MNIVEKARSLSEMKRKMIFWMILIIIALIMALAWMKNAQDKFKNINLQRAMQNINFPTGNPSQ